MPIILGFFLILIDQLSKYIYVALGAKDITVINGILNLTYVENKGAAWGAWANNQIVLYTVSAIMIATIIGFTIKNYRKMPRLMRYSVMLVLAGAIGNMIDRLCFHYVRDMFEFAFIEFPVFNVADATISIGAVLLLIDCLFLEGKHFFDSQSAKDVKTDPINPSSDTTTSDDNTTNEEQSQAGTDKQSPIANGEQSQTDTDKQSPIANEEQN